MEKLTAKQVAEIKAILKKDDLAGVEITMHGRNFKIYRSPFDEYGSALEGITMAGNPDTYYIKELVKKEKSVFDTDRLEKQVDKVNEILKSIPEEAWTMMVENSDIEDADFLVEDYDEFTVSVIKEEIRKRRKVKEAVNKYDGTISMSHLKEVMDKIDKEWAERELKIFTGSKGEEEIRKAMMDELSMDVRQRDRERAMRMRQYEQEQREKINQLMQIRGSGKGILEQIDARVSEIDKDLENLYPLPPSKGDAPRKDGVKDVLGAFMSKVRRGKWNW